MHTFKILFCLFRDNTAAYRYKQNTVFKLQKTLLSNKTVHHLYSKWSQLKWCRAFRQHMMHWARLRTDIGIPFTTDGFLLNELLVQSTKPAKKKSIVKVWCVKNYSAEPSAWPQRALRDTERPGTRWRITHSRCTRHHVEPLTLLLT